MTSIQTPIGGWHRETSLGTEVRESKRPQADTLVMDAPTGWKPVAREDVLKKNPKPILYQGGLNNGFEVLPWNHPKGNTLNYRPGENGGWYAVAVLLYFTIVLAPLGVVCSLIGETKARREIMRKIGWTETGPDLVQYGRYEVHNGRLYFVGA